MILNRNELLSIKKPARYTNNELNAAKKDWDATAVRLGLVFPEMYQIAESGLGLKILYGIVNSQPNYLADRIYAPDIDFETLLKDTGRELLSLENEKRLREFDLLGVTLQFELTYTNILTILSLGNIPFLSSERDESYPLLFAGGPSAFNPEPLAQFFDFFCIGDGEEIIVEVLKEYEKIKDKKLSKNEILESLVNIEGVYIPSFYEVTYDESSRIKEFKPVKEKYPNRIKKRIVKNLDTAYFPTCPIVPFEEAVHDRIILELYRGCTAGCRFCQAGIIYRPLRERSPEVLLNQAIESYDKTGYGEISLVSLSSVDYSNIIQLLDSLREQFKDNYIETSLSSLRMNSFSIELAQKISTARKTGLTFAPEAGSQRLRDVINKGVTKDDIFNTLINAKKAGWKKVKLYFMLGLPTETEDDLNEFIALVEEILAKTGLDLTISFSLFVPKSHTPFQWENQVKTNIFQDKINIINNLLPRKKLNLDFHNIFMSFIEGIFSRGDRRLTPVLIDAWRFGARFDGWGDYFDISIWHKALEKNGIDIDYYIYRKRDFSEILPWDFIDSGINKAFLQKENELSKKSVTTSDCKQNKCNSCGLTCKTENRVEKKELSLISSPLISPDSERYKYQICFSKKSHLVYIGHLALMRVIEMALRRAKLPVVYSEGFHPRMKMSITSALSVGVTGENEWLELELNGKFDEEDLKIKINAVLPSGLCVKRIKRVSLKDAKLAARILSFKYKVLFKTDNVELFKEALSHFVKLHDGFSINYEFEGESSSLLFEIVNGSSLKVKDILGFFADSEFSFIVEDIIRKEICFK